MAHPVLAPLAVEVAKPEYDGLSNAQIAAAVNAKTVATAKLVDIGDAVTVLRENGGWYSIKAAAGSNMAAMAAVDIVDDLRAQTINIENPMVQQMGGGLVATNVLTQAQWDAVVALGTVQKAWTESTMGLPFVSEHDVAAVKV